MGGPRASGVCRERRCGAPRRLPAGRGSGRRAAGARPSPRRRGSRSSPPRHGRPHHVSRGLSAVHAAPHRAPPHGPGVRHAAQRLSPALGRRPPSAAPSSGRGGETVSGRRWRSVLLLGTLVLVACSRGEGDQGKAKGARPAVPVTAARAEARDMPVQIQGIGNVQALATVSVYSLLNGQIFQVHFKEGQDVKEGQLLFTIDPRPFEAALQQAQATLAQHQAAVAQAEANLARDQAQADNAAVEEERYKKLVNGGLIAREQYDQILTAHKSAVATVDADRAAVINAKALVQADAAMVENAKVQLSYTAIRAPIEGRTGNLLIHQGNVVKANDIGNPMVVINRVHPIYISFAVPE